MKITFTKLQVIIVFLIANLCNSSFVFSQSLTSVEKSAVQKIVILLTDTDGDGVPDENDNCPNTFNPTQVDSDADMIGDACDHCPNVANPDQLDSDNDMIGDACDNCPNVANPDQSDSDNDMIGNVCDNCPNVANPDQMDSDGDRIGNVCDNCTNVANPDQLDSDIDMIGDVCDNCPNAANPDQSDSDINGIGNACETVGIDNLSDANSFLVYLDPHSNTLIVNGKGISNIEVYTVSGEIVVKKHSNSNRTSIDLSNNAPGIYFVKTTTKSKITVKKILLTSK